MPSEGPESKSFQKFLDTQQYTSTGILRYERIFGEGFVSTGGMGKDFDRVFSFVVVKGFLSVSRHILRPVPTLLGYVQLLNIDVCPFLGHTSARL